MTEPPNSSKVWDKLRDAGLISLAKWCGAAVVAYGALLLIILIVQLVTPEAAGTFGDAFAVLTSFFNALAFAAVVATVVLQTQELEENREELKKQAVAQQAWANAATAQIELTKQLEAVRIRPVIKCEWEMDQMKASRIIFWIRNVGLGVAIVTKLEFEIAGATKVEVERHGSDQARQAWRSAVNWALGDNDIVKSQGLFQFDDLNRALAPSERQAFYSVGVEQTERHNVFTTLKENFRPVIHFVSANGEKRTTENQFNELLGPVVSNPH